MRKPDPRRTKISVPEYAASLGVSVDKVHAFIRNGELRAMNGATKMGGRPRYLIDIKDIESFETRRLVLPEKPVVRRSKPPKPKGMKEYF